MSLKILYKNSISDGQIKNYVVFADENFKINGLNKLSLGKDSNQINKTINSNKSKKKEFIIFNYSPDQKIIIVKIKNNQSSTENEKNGANFYNFVKSNLITNLTFFDNNILATQTKNKIFLEEFIHGMQIKGYEFNKYKTKKEITDININIVYRKKIPSKIKNNVYVYVCHFLFCFIFIKLISFNLHSMYKFF